MELRHLWLDDKPLWVPVIQGIRPKYVQMVRSPSWALHVPTGEVVQFTDTLPQDEKPFRPAKLQATWHANAFVVIEDEDQVGPVIIPVDVARHCQLDEGGLKMLQDQTGLPLALAA